MQVCQEVAPEPELLLEDWTLKSFPPYHTEL